MANEIKVTGESDQADLTYEIFYDNSGIITSRGVAAALTEQPVSSGVYKASPAVILPGDTVIVYKAGEYVAGDEYQPSVELAATGLDNISATEPTGIALTFADKLTQLYARFFNKVKKDKSAKTITVYQVDGVTPMTEQDYDEETTFDSVEKAT